MATLLPSAARLIRSAARMKWFGGCLALTLLLAGCASEAAQVSPPDPRRLTVFAAASLTDAFTEIGQKFDAAHPGVTTTLNFGGSQTLRTQLEQGAIADVFASANLKEMDSLVADELVGSNAARVFLTNRLQVILPEDNPANFHSLEELSRPGVKLVLAAEEVPAGRYARQVLENLTARYGAGYRAAVLANVVSNEDNVRQVVAKVLLGEADAGIVYLSDAVAAPELVRLPIPDAYNVAATYPIAVLSTAPYPELAAEFIRYVLSADGQAVLSRWGFTTIAP